MITNVISEETAKEVYFKLLACEFMCFEPPKKRVKTEDKLLNLAPLKILNMS